MSLSSQLFCYFNQPQTSFLSVSYKQHYQKPLLCMATMSSKCQRPTFSFMRRVELFWHRSLVHLRTLRRWTEPVQAWGSSHFTAESETLETVTRTGLKCMMKGYSIVPRLHPAFRRTCVTWRWPGDEANEWVYFSWYLANVSIRCSSPPYSPEED